MPVMFPLLRQQSYLTGRRCFQTAGPRYLHITSRLAAGKREALFDKDKINTEPNEYSKSGSDAEAAKSDVAFDASKTKPETQEKNAGDELNASPANTHMGVPSSKQDDAGSSPSENSSSTSSRARTSGGGSPKKGGSGPGQA